MPAPTTWEEWWQGSNIRGILTGIVDALRLPGDVYQGHIDPASDEAIGRAFDLAGTLTLGAGAIPRGAGMELRTGLSVPRRERRRFQWDYYGTPVTVWQNPSQEQLAGFLGRTKYQAARRLIDDETGDVFVWDANDPALHELMAQQLGLRRPRGDMIGLEGPIPEGMQP